MKYQDDQYYIERVLRGDANAFAGIVNKHKNYIFSIIFKILQNREDSEEIAQDVFLKVYQSLQSFQGKSKFSTWIYRIAYNAAISKSRKKHFDTISMDDVRPDLQPSEEMITGMMRKDEAEQTDLLKFVVASLPEEDQLLITLFYQMDNSIEDISEITGLSVSNVKVRLHRIRKKLYIEMQALLHKETNKVLN